eukprot:2251709-Rhodomonas_salina.1
MAGMLPEGRMRPQIEMGAGASSNAVDYAADADEGDKLNDSLESKLEQLGEGEEEGEDVYVTRELLDILATAGHKVLIPFQVEEFPTMPVKANSWIPFEELIEHLWASYDRWITQRCTSAVWLSGHQGWYIITGLIQQRQVRIHFSDETDCYETEATEQLKRQRIQVAARPKPKAGNGATP